MNLLTNASEALEGEDGVVSVRTGVVGITAEACLSAAYSAGVEGEHIFLEVGDNGVGMEPSVRTRIFDPFFTTKFTGRGLGMAAVLGIVRSHNGSLFVESEPGQGTTFRVTFPARDHAAATVQAAHLQSEDTLTGSGTISSSMTRRRCGAQRAAPRRDGLRRKRR